MPEDGDDKAPFNLDERSRSIALIVVGVLAAVALVGDSWGAFWFPWPLAIVALVALWLLTRNNPPTRTARRRGRAVRRRTRSRTRRRSRPAEPVRRRRRAPAYYPPQPPPYVAPPVVQRIPNPRKRGPILFWFTLALIALGEGLLGIVDLAGADVADPAYPALAVAICGVMLLVGAFFGRAGGIILVGLVATVALAGATAADRVGRRDPVDATPTTAASRPGQLLDRRRRAWSSTCATSTTSAASTDAPSSSRATSARIEVILPRGLAATVTPTSTARATSSSSARSTAGSTSTQTAFERVGHRPADHHQRPAGRRRDRGAPMSTTTTTTAERQSGRHPVNVGHLVMGIAFLGLVGVWALIQGDVVGGGDVRWLLPVPWVLAGLAGLLAIGVSGSKRWTTRQAGWVAARRRPDRPPDHHRRHHRHHGPETETDEENR